MLRPSAATACVLLAVILTSCTNHRKAVPDVVQTEKKQLPNFAGRSPKTVNMESLSIDVPVGTHIGELSFGWSGSCMQERPLTYKHGTVKVSPVNYAGMFKEAMQSLGVPVEQPARFAGEEVKKADLNFAATIRELTLNACFPEVSKDQDHAVGEAYVRVEWSAFSPIERKIVYSFITEGRTPPDFETRLADDGLIAEALRDSMLRMFQQPEFESVLTVASPGTSAKGVKKAAFANAPRLAGGLTKNMGHLRAAVVTVFANAGQGSGFAVGKGDHVLTAAHVVAGSKFVKLATPDGKQHYGEVVRSNAARDLAVIKLDGGALKPLPITPGVPGTGAEVFAVGSPMGDKFSVSVTKGIVSGLRTEDGLDYVQSDVNVLPGSSGGPLVDADGNVVGVTLGGLSFSGAPSGMNFFTPARDVLRFLEES